MFRSVSAAAAVVTNKVVTNVNKKGE
jgi:hypothetical protein